MSHFILRAHVNAVEISVRGEHRPGGWMLTTPGGPTRARSLADAIRKAAAVIGPKLQKAQATSSVWGLHIAAGGAEALFGEWMPVEARPEFVPDPPTRKSEIQRIYAEWQRHDGSPLGALEAASKIIEIYAEHPQAMAA